MFLVTDLTIDFTLFGLQFIGSRYSKYLEPFFV